MKIEIEQQTLQALLQRVMGVVEKRNTIPILSNILLSADVNELSIRATDLDIDVVTSASATVSIPGSCTVRADLIGAIVGKLQKSKPILIEYADGNMSINSGKSSFNLATLPVDDYPLITSPQYASDFTISGASLDRLLSLSSMAMSSEETRYYLNGVYFHPINGNVAAVATDGHRLAKIESDTTADFNGVIIPRKTVTELRKIVGDDEVQVSVSDHKIRFGFGDTELTSKTIEGTFPDYTRVIPKDNDKSAKFDASAVKDASARVSLVATERTKAVKLDFTQGNVTLTVNGTDGDLGIEDVEAEYSGPDMRIGLNSKYLAEVLQTCTGDTVEMMLHDSGSPVLIKPSGDELATYVVMPVRV